MEPSRHDGLAELHRRYYPELVRLAFALTGDWGLAEELGQEAFVRAWRSWGSIRRKQSAPAYLRATVINLAPAGHVRLLPVLDPYLQGYRNRERCIDPRHHSFIVDRGGNVTSVILIDGRAAGVWDLVVKPSPELRLFFFASPDAQTRRAVHTLAAELPETLTGDPVRVVERDHMTPLTQGTAGSFLSPLKDPH